MKLITSLLVLCLSLSVGLALAQTDMAGNTDNMSGMDNMTSMCDITGIMTLTPMDITGDQAGGNMTGGQTYNVTATVLYMPGTMGNMTEGTEAENMTDNVTGMGNMTEAKICYITGIATSVPADMTGNQAGGNMTGGQTYNITATVMCMPEVMNNMTGGAGNMTEGSQTGNMTGMDNMTAVVMCNVTGIMTLTPADMTGPQAGNMTSNQTYDITATVMCMPEAMNNMTGGSQAGNMTGMSNMTGVKTCDITGIATSMPAGMAEGQAGNMTGDQKYSITATVTCMPEAMNNMTGNMVNITGASQGKDIIETARDAGNFTTLLTAVNAANLTDTLKGQGPFTVFAPTDEAFASLPEGTVEALLNDTNTLTKILLYHVAGQELMAKDVVNMSNITTLEGQELPVNVTDEGVFVGKAKIIMTDIDASNGVIHVIDAVLIPPKAEGQTVAENMTGTQAGNMTAGQTGTTM
jgi:uncharacterized surface protein with fasciclin (FAS1) repeats